MTSSTPPGPEYEFNNHQADVIHGLAYRMSGVGFVFMLLGILQIGYGIAVYIASRDPIALQKAADAAKIPIEDLRPASILATSVAIGAVGLIYFLVGLWTRQAAVGFSAIVRTRGQDISRLMEALGSLRKAYGLVYNLMLFAAVILLVSIGMSVYRQWGR